jgi:hypothetical protein
VVLFCNPASGGTFSSTAIEIIKWVKKFAVAQAKVTHILRPGKASEKTPKGVIPPSLCEISHNTSRKKNHVGQMIVVYLETLFLAFLSPHGGPRMNPTPTPHFRKIRLTSKEQYSKNRNSLEVYGSPWKSMEV